MKGQMKAIQNVCESAVLRGMGFQPMNHRQDADATKSHGQSLPPTRSGDARAPFHTCSQGTLFTLLAILATASLPAWGQYAGGTGTGDDPYLIETAEQVNTIGLYPEDWNKHFRLTADIDMNDLSGAKVNLIGTFQSPFGGVFDGNDHTIANLVYLVKDEDSPPTSSSVVDIGLFRVISGWEALVQDLGLIDPNVRPDPDCTRDVLFVGALAGRLSEGWIRNCYVQGGHVLGYNGVGGLIGRCRSNAAVSECWSTAEVSGIGAVGGNIPDVVRELTSSGHSVGGLIGNVGEASVWSCHAGARVSASVDVGGLVGNAMKECIIEDCFTTGTVAGSQAGGLVGGLEGSVSRCYSTASVSGDPGSWSLGGLVGVNHGDIHASWAGGDVTGGQVVGGLVGYNSVGGVFIIPYFDAKVTDSYATGAVRGEKSVGGLMGSNEGTVLRCYATGPVTTNGKGSFGGLMARDGGVPEWDVQGCFWDKTTSGVDISAAGTGLTTAQMQDLATYLAAGWDFTGETANGTEDLWKMSDNGPAYPKLAWEETPTDDPLVPQDTDQGDAANVWRKDR